MMNLTASHNGENVNLKFAEVKNAEAYLTNLRNNFGSNPTNPMIIGGVEWKLEKVKVETESAKFKRQEEEKRRRNLIRYARQVEAGAPMVPRETASGINPKASSMMDQLVAKISG